MKHKQKTWQAKWVMDPVFDGLIPIDTFHKELDKKPIEEHRKDLMNRHMLVRKTFIVGKVNKSASICISADDYYKLSINGRFVGQGPAPGYPFDYKYNAHDISDYLIEGENVIAVHVYYQGLINRVWNSGDYRQGLIAEVWIDDKICLMTDKTWKYQLCNAYKTRGTIGYDTQFYEDFDSRLYDPGWVEIGYDDKAWGYLSEHKSVDYAFAEPPAAALSVWVAKPVKVDQYHENTFLIDFGQELTGQFSMTAQGASGQVIEVRCGEELDEVDKTHVRYKMRCNCDYQEYWTLSGGVDTLNNYDYKAFRYVEVILPDRVEILGEFSVVVRHYPFEDSDFRYTSNNEMVDRVLEVCKQGVKYGTQEIYVDCPSREKGQYLGDFTVTGHSHIYLTGKLDLYQRTLKDFADSTQICPGMMAVAPSNRMQEIADFSMQWPMQLYQYYRQSGDMALLRDLYDVLVGLENYFKNYEREDGLLVEVCEKWNLVDWPENLRDGYDFEMTKPIGKGCHNVINSHYYGMLFYADKIREIIGMAPENNLEKLKQSFVAAFYDKDRKLFVDSEGSEHSAVHSNALPLLYDMFPTKDTDKAVTLIKSRAQNCGVQMSYFVLRSLAIVGEYEAVYTLIEKLWSTMVEEGATTCFEAWGKDQKQNTSLCHPWASAPISLMVEVILGINPATPGWDGIVFTPHIPEALTSFHLSVTLPCGQVSLQKENNVLTMTAPEGIKVECETAGVILL